MRMRTPRLALATFAVLALLAGASCVHSGSTASGHRDLPSGPPALALVPADTPYVLAMLAPMDPAIQQKMFARAARVLEKNGAQLRGALSGEDVAAGRIVGAWLDELQGHMTVEGTTQLGLNPNGRIVVYGVSLFPVVRIEIGDPARLHATILRVLAKAQVPVTEQHAGAQAYWQFADDKVAGVIAIVGNELVATVSTTAALPELLPYVFGQVKPEQSLADTGLLRQLANTHHYDGGIVGFLDFEAGARLAFGETPSPVALPFLEKSSAVSAPCKKEVHRLIGYAPRLVFGLEKVAANETTFAMTLATAPAISHALAGLSRPIAGLTMQPGDTPPLAVFGIGLSVSDGIAVLRRGAAAIEAEPFECPEMLELNTLAKELDQNLGHGIPPMVTSLNGVVVTLDELDLKASPPLVSGSALLVGEGADDLLRQGLAFLAPGQGNGLAADGRPVALSLASHGIPGVDQAYVGLKADRAALAIGRAASQRVVALLGAAGPARAPLVVLAMDLARLMKLIPEFAGKMQDTPFGGDDLGFASYGLEADGELGVTLRFYQQTK
jgi:hypothetical protein